MEIALHVHVVQRILSYISGYTGPIFAIFLPYESALRADDGSLPYFSISQGTFAMATKSFVNVRYNTAKKLAYFVKYCRIYWTYFRNLCTIWKLFMYRWWICTFFLNLVNFRPRNLGVYAVKTCNFCLHAPAIFIRQVGVSKWKLCMYRWCICTIFSNLSRNVAMATKIMLRQMRK